MARAKKKLWRPVKALPPQEWAPFKDAWQRVEATVPVNDLWLIQHDLKQAFLARRLIGAARRIAADGKEKTPIILDRASYWRRLSIKYSYLITGYEADDPGVRWIFYVRRPELDKHYPDAVSATTPIERQPPTSEHRADAPSRDGDRPRRRPGRQPKHDWPKHVTREVIRRLRAGEKEPTAPEMLQWCGDKWDWQPDIRQMQQLLRDLL
jgi:hypothetical protein